MNRSRKALLAAAVAVALGNAACGSENGSTFADPTRADAPTGGGTLAADPAGSSSIGPRGTASACVTDVKQGELAPTNLVFIYDKSGSMGDPAGGFDPAKKWIPVSTGIEQFFADPSSATMRASLQFFPLDDDTIATTCAYPYQNPTVPLTSASDPIFTNTIEATQPSGGTPTLPALAGAIAYAQTIAAAHPSDKTAVVLVTDGEPGFYDPGSQTYVAGCEGNDVDHAAGAAKAAFEGSHIPTYVIGVGPALDALNAIAAAGGTSHAVRVDVTDPAATKSAIVSSLDAIRLREVACDFAIPPPPDGKQIDVDAVNVVLARPDGSENVLGYSKDCGDANGWRYDDEASPTKVLLCSSACTDARQSASGKVSLAFGCKTQLALR